MRIGLCLLTWNELPGCQLDVPRIPRDSFDEVFAMDGGSTDGTCEYLAGQRLPVFQQELPGYNGAYLSAFRRTTSEALVLFHPKGSIDPLQLLRFRPLLEAGHELVIASRIGRGSINEEDRKLVKPRKWFVMALALFAAALWRREGSLIWDVLHGVRAMRKDTFFAIEPLDRGLSIDLEMVVRGYRHRLRRIEFPIAETPRPFGGTHFKALPTGWKLLRYAAAELFRKAPQRKPS